MSEVPQGWAEATVLELAGQDSVVTDGDWVESKDQDPLGSVRLIQLADIGDGFFINKSQRFMNSETVERLNCTHLHEGDVLIARMPDPLGRACIFPDIGQQAVTAVDVFVWRPDRKLAGAEPRWLMHTINSPVVRSEIQSEAGGTTRQRVAGGKLKQLRLPVPPLPEQRRIVAKVDGLTERVARARKELNRIPTLIARYKQRLLALAFSGELTAGWRAQDLNESQDAIPSAPAQHTDESERGVWEWETLPAGWDWVPFGSTFTDVTDSKRKVQTKEYREEGRFPVIDQGIAQIAGYTDREEMVQLAKPPYVVFGDHTRCVKLVRSRFVQGADGVKVLNPTAAFNAAYLYFALQCVQLPDKGYSRHMKFLRATHFPKCSLQEQAEIVRRIEFAFGWLDRMAADHAAAARLLSKLDAAILRKALRGELVPQDPNDEPASVLLERIRGARDTAPKAKRGRKPNGSKAQLMTEKALPPCDRLLKDSEKWPVVGLPFEAIAMRNSMPHDTLRDALFELLSAPKPALQQRFDNDAEVMVIQRVPA